MFLVAPLYASLRCARWRSASSESIQARDDMRVSVYRSQSECSHDRA